MAEQNPLHPKAPQQIGADTIHSMLTYGLGIGEGSSDPLMAVLQTGVSNGLRNVAEGYVSKDLTEQARARRAMQGIIATRQSARFDEEKHEPTFEDTTYSPEELQAGLLGVSKLFATDAANRVLHTLSVPVPESEQQEAKSAPLFSPEEEPVAAGLLGLGLGLAQAAEKAGKLLKPSAGYSEELMAELRDGYAKAGFLKGSPEEQAAAFDRISKKFFGRLEATIEANEIERRKARREVAKL